LFSTGNLVWRTWKGKVFATITQPQKFLL
jgi:hypothetical protein